MEMLNFMKWSINLKIIEGPFYDHLIKLFDGRRGIAPTRNCTHLLKSVLDLFVCIKLNFFLTIFLSWFCLKYSKNLLGIIFGFEKWAFFIYTPLLVLNYSEMFNLRITWSFHLEYSICAQKPKQMYILAFDLFWKIQLIHTKYAFTMIVWIYLCKQRIHNGYCKF